MLLSILYTKLATQATQRIPLSIFLIRKYMYKMTKEKDFFLSPFICAWHYLFYIFSYNSVRTDVS